MYGFDFFLSPPNEQNQYFFENARLRPFRFADIDYLVTLNNWIQTGRTRSTCYQIHDGRFTVTFSADQILRGSYHGELAGKIEFVNYGWVLCRGCVSLVIQYSPVCQEPTDGTFVQSGASSITQFLVMENQKVSLRFEPWPAPSNTGTAKQAWESHTVWIENSYCFSYRILSSNFDCIWYAL